MTTPACPSEVVNEHFTCTLTPHSSAGKGPASYTPQRPREYWAGWSKGYVTVEREPISIREVLHLVYIEPGMALLLTAPPSEKGAGYVSASNRAEATPNAYLVYVDGSGSVGYECAAPPPRNVAEVTSMTPVSLNGDIVFIGGCTNNPPSVIVYSVDTDTWRQVQHTPDQGLGFFTTLAVFVLGDVATVIHQRSLGSGYRSTSDWEVWTYDPQTDAWRHHVEWDIHPRFVSNQFLVLDDRAHLFHMGKVAKVFSLETGWDTPSTCPPMSPPSGTTLMPMGRHIVSVNRYTGDVAGYSMLKGTRTPWGKWWTDSTSRMMTGRVSCCRMSHDAVLVVSKYDTAVLRFSEDIVCPEPHETDDILNGTEHK
ncbi:hypothetical protein KIPB_006199 [Kipferlia bialata]|uniref:Uncharacterized protein n=1 Tax=Kipferlia bialata TaxID=797122 RepID=A0A9K3CP39_9EUKA|nr:hypothetical protein KIPB_001513 [Kipferlia bialata]GIQ84663.1 hypothetical protein KIPB_006199 [Kipferlia bialata]|eukprot:g1513.t1